METLKRFSAGTAEVVFGWVVGTAGFAYHLSFFFFQIERFFHGFERSPWMALDFLAIQSRNTSEKMISRSRQSWK